MGSSGWKAGTGGPERKGRGLRVRTQCERPQMVPGGSVKVFLGDKGSRGPVCPQLWAASLGNALCVRFHGALGVTKCTCLTLGMKYTSTSASTERGPGSMCV